MAKMRSPVPRSLHGDGQPKTIHLRPHYRRRRPFSTPPTVLSDVGRLVISWLFGPILHREIGEVREVDDMVGHQDQSVNHGDRGDLTVHKGGHLAEPTEAGSLFGVPVSSPGVVGQDGECRSQYSPQVQLRIPASWPAPGSASEVLGAVGGRPAAGRFVEMRKRARIGIGRFMAPGKGGAECLPDYKEKPRSKSW